MPLENSPVKRPFDEESTRKTKKQLLDAVENQHVSYVTPQDEGYAPLLASKYSNFVIQRSQEFPNGLQENLAWAFNTLQAEGFFHRDWVRVKGRSFPTYVSRVLIGEPGVTYKYLGLRLFPLPWTFPGRSPENDIEEACSILGELNAYFKEMSRKLIADKNDASVSSELACANTNTSVCTSSSDEGTSLNGNQEHAELKDEVQLDQSTGAEISGHFDRVNEQSKNLDDVAQNSESKSSSTNSKDVLKSDTKSSSTNSVDVSESNTKSPLRCTKDALEADTKSSSTNSKNVLESNTKSSLTPSSKSALEADKKSSSTSPKDTLKSDASTKSECNIPSVNSAASNTGDRVTMSLESDTSTKSQCNLPSINPAASDTEEQPSMSVEEGTDFNVALLNFMDPNDPTLRLKVEPYYGMGELAVSWHMDTGLMKGSTVAVYNHTETENCEREDCNKWCIGVKVQWDVETPALAVPLDTGDSYYLLSDLNDTHQHCVVVGSHPRYSTTHRVAECSTGTLSYIQDRCHQALDNLQMGEGDANSSLKSTSIDVLALTEDVHTEVEFEWIRQFWMQGNTRANERVFWLQPMEDLEEMWMQMELMTKLAVTAAMEGSSREHHVLCERMIDFLSRRNRLRQEHINRFGGKALVTMPSDEMPSYRPYWSAADAHHPLPFDLDDIIHRLICHIDGGHT